MMNRCLQVLLVGQMLLALPACTSSAPLNQSKPTPAPTETPSSIVGQSQPITSPTAPIASPTVPSSPAIQSPATAPKDSSTIAPAAPGSSVSSGGWSGVSGDTTSVTTAMRDLGAKTVGNEIQIDLASDVLFDFDKYNIRKDANTALEKLLTIVKDQAPNREIRIDGHTDSIGDDRYNQVLSENRANAIKAWLVSKKIESDRITTQGFGETQPIASNTNPDSSDNPTNRQKNRRVRITLAPPS